MMDFFNKYNPIVVSRYNDKKAKRERRV